MGDHRQALETLEKVLRSQKEPVETIDPAFLVDQVYKALRLYYNDPFASVLSDPVTCQAVLAAILSQRRYEVLERIGCTNLTVDNLQSVGFFRWTREGRLECAFILLVKLMRKVLVLVGELDFDKQLTRLVLVWQRFDHFMAFYRRVKSIAFRNTLVGLSTFHDGARFGATGGVVVTERKSRWGVEAEHEYDTKSVSGDSVRTTNSVDTKVSGMNSIIINGGTSASAGDVFMRVQLEIEHQQDVCNEVLRCKVLQTKERLTETMYAEERDKAVNEADVFLLITSGHVSEFHLPPRYGIVSIDEFTQYFGPFASRAYRSFQEPPNINEATYKELCWIEGLGVATARKMVEERKKRSFSEVEEAVSRLFSNKKGKTADIIRCMHCA